MLRVSFRSLLLLASPVITSGCTCDEPTSPTVPAPHAAASPAPACAPLPSVAAWHAVHADFFEARLPPSFHEAKVKDGKGFRDEKAHRRIQFSKVDLPTAGMSVSAAVDKLNDGVREQASDASLGLRLGPTHRGGTKSEPWRYYLVTSGGRTFVQGLVGRLGIDRRLHAVLIIYEDDETEAPTCIEHDGKALVDTVSIPRSVTGLGSSSSGPAAPPPPLRFTPAAVEELRRQLRPGETVWVGVDREGSEISYRLNVGKKVPPNVESRVMDGLPVAVDRESLPWLSGVTVDFITGRGFRFDRGAAPATSR